MHPENKLTTNGKQVVSSSETQISDANQQQGLGTKGVGIGSHGVKTNQVSPGLNSVGPSGVGGGVTMLKTKTKRERAISMDAGDLRDSLEPDAKDGVMRSKRRCVLEKKQPYSGDEWCSGGDTEEDEDKPNMAVHRERMITGTCGTAGVGGQSSAPPAGYAFSSGGLRSDLPRPAQQVVYVFTTSLANSAAEAVIHGHTDSILMFHQQNVPRTKLDQCLPAMRKLPSLPEQLSSRSTPPMGTLKSQNDTPRPASVGGAIGTQVTGSSSSSVQPQEADLPVQQPLDGPSSSHQPLQGSAGPPAGDVTGPGGAEGVGNMAHPSAGVSPTSSTSVLPAHLQGEGPQRLSKEQLEHRERSLQTLRDIERLLLRSGVSGGSGDLEGPNGNPGAIHSNSININNNNNTDNNGRTQEGSESTKNAENMNNNNLPLDMSEVGTLKKYEEPLQSIMSQTQNLGGSRLDDPAIGPHLGLPTQQHHHMSSPPELDLGLLQDHDGLTPEQMAWRKLQEEYYQEKRRQQEMHPHSHPQHYRMMAEMGMPRGPHLMMRGPPPPYHSKSDEQWGPAPLMGGGMGSNPRLIDIHQDGSQGPRFVGQMQRGPSGTRGYPVSPGRVLTMEGLGLQRSGMGWVEDLPLNIGGGRSLLHGCYPPGGPGGPSQHLHGDPERQLMREEVLRIMEKRQLQRLEQERLAVLQQQQQQQQEGMGQSRLLNNTGRPSLPNQVVGIGPHGDTMDFPHSQAIMHSPLGRVREGDGPSLRDLGESPLSTHLIMNVNLNAQEQQVLAQKLRGVNRVGEVLSPEDISRLRAGQNGRGGASKAVITGPEGPVQFSNQRFCGGQSERSYLKQTDQANFGPDQQGTTLGSSSHLSHMPLDTGPRGSDSCPRHPSNLSVNVNSMGSPTMAPPHPLKSPSIGPEPSPLMPSPSASVLKSPTPVSTTSPSHPHLPAASRAGTPSSTSMKSPQMIGTTSLGMHSPSGSPGHQKSPVMNMASPSWTTSPKTSMPSPGRPPNGKGMGNGTSNSETGPTLPPKSSNSTVTSQPSSLNSSMPFTSSPDAPPSQNPLSLIMSQMSKYAMSSSAPLYHEAIKTISTSDDEMMPDRPLLPGVNMEGTHHPSPQMLLSSQSGMGPPGSPQSPIGMLLQGQQQLSHGPPGSMLSSPNLMSMSGMNSGIVGGAGGLSGGIGPCNASLHPQNQMMGFPRMQAPSQGPPHSPVGALSQHYSQHPDDMLPPQQFHLLGKGLPHQQPTHPSDSFLSMRMSDGPDLSDVIRPSHTGIPEFDLSRIIPSDKPSSTLQYFPKSEGMSQPQPNSHHGQAMQQPPPTQLLKQLSSGPHHSNAASSNPHIANLQNMMAEQQLSIHPSHYGIRAGMPQSGGRGMVVGPMNHPGHMMVRTGLGPQQQQQYHQQQQQVMMSNSLQHHPSHPHPSMMSPQQQHTHNLMAQQSLMMMQAKQRGMSIPGEQLGQQGPLMSPQGLIMAPSHPGMMGPQSLRQRGMSLNSPLGYAPGNIHNMPF
ncbi:B-cell CLL/lymphoma 9-like protein [Alosa sapidissima]|uniref:B-cell CLL/lymphoma 9-like protein n=1 Tax=Alosa sapidissima TaxID=34773 RepID=UPI001C093125|nr:B-cell CLL/lymphoma 9-like protein [Alosa sapidissima]XP_041920022.1 B-cell CLL/lymphoma 9-like protein [Alosa sapidissima]XP_041920023.1 B-cell CLL/lymphoma 9-like protein [Alosa sapidissima]